jgi:hypothetical protein
MSITASLTVTPVAPNHGDTVTAVYGVQGNDPVPPQAAAVTGIVTVGGAPVDVTTTLTMPGQPAEPVSYAAPVCAGLSFSQSPADPTGATWTAVVP